MKLEGDETPLHWAVLSGNQEIVQTLLNFYAEVNAQNNEGKTPLHYACSVGNTQLCNLLCASSEIIIDIPDKDGNTPLHLAC